MRVLVTGSAGFIGKALRDVLELRDHTVVPFDYPRDVRERMGVAQAVDGADAVINLAGVLGTEEMFGAEHRAAEVNILGALNLFDAAHHGPRRRQDDPGGVPVDQPDRAPADAARRTGEHPGHRPGPGLPEPVALAA
jgi:hypothetical protein